MHARIIILLSFLHNKCQNVAQKCVFLICISSLKDTKQSIFCSPHPSPAEMRCGRCGLTCFYNRCQALGESSFTICRFPQAPAQTDQLSEKRPNRLQAGEKGDRWRKTEGDNERSRRKPVDTAGKRDVTKIRERNKDSPEERGGNDKGAECGT